MQLGYTMESSHVKDAKVSLKELFKINESTPAWQMEIVKLTKLSVIVVNIVDSKNVFRKAWC